MQSLHSRFRKGEGLRETTQFFDAFRCIYLAQAQKRVHMATEESASSAATWHGNGADIAILGPSGILKIATIRPRQDFKTNGK